jgi:hypothetical protein
MTDDLRANVGLVRRALLQEKVEVEQPKTSRNERRPKLNMDDDENDLSYWESDDAELDELDVL